MELVECVLCEGGVHAFVCGVCAVCVWCECGVCMVSVYVCACVRACVYVCSCVCVCVVGWGGRNVQGVGRGTGKVRWASYVKLTVKLTSPVTLWKARSRLYRHRFLQPNTHFSAFSENTTYEPSHCSNLKIC